MKCKIILDTEIVPSFEDFEKANEFTLVGNLTNSISKLIHYSNHGWLLNEEQKLYKLNQGWNFVYLGKLQPSKTFNSSLTFNILRKANIARLPEFKNSKGEPAHSKPDGSDWSPAQWLQAVIGELGEYANVMKKVERGDLTFEEAKPLIEKELADVQIYFDILAFRVGVDLAKATENKFNEVSERIGCGLRIENNEVVRKEIEKTGTYGFVLPTYPQAVDFAKLGSGELTKLSIDNRKSYVSPTKEELQDELVKIKEKTRARNESMQEKCGTSVLDNYDYNPKNGEFTPKIKFTEPKTIEFEIEKGFECSGKCGVESWQVPTVGTITNIKVQTTNSVINENVTLSISENDEIKVSVKPKMSDEEFKAAKETCRISKEQALVLLKARADSYNDLFKQMYHQQYLDKYKEHAYPLEVDNVKISRNIIIDLFVLNFQGIDNGKQYLFSQIKEMFAYKRIPNRCFTQFVFQTYLFDFFSKQLGTKITGILINGSKENTKLNPDDLIQFYDDRNVLYNFRLVKSSDKNVEVSAT